MKPAARVVPNVPSFSVERGFWYSIPDHLADDISVGTIVRVPLSGRKVRGWVVEVGQSDSARLKDVAGVSGTLPVFDVLQLKSLEWAANHYVAPLPTLLARVTPPNLPKHVPEVSDVPSQASDHPLNEVSRRSAVDKKTPVTAVIGNWHDLMWISSLGLVLSAGHSVLVLTASVAETEALADAARELFGANVVAVTREDAAADTHAWEAAQSPPRLVIGTPKVASWHVENLGMVVVLEENRRAMKDRQTPTIHVRDMMITRSRIERFNLVFYGPTPGVELLAGGAEVIRVGNRAWPLVEVVDRTEDVSGFVSSRTMAAIKGAVAAGRRVFVYTHRRAGSASTRCARCRQLRRCSSCEARLGRVSECPKCSTPTGPCSNCRGTEFEELGTVPDRLVIEINKKSGGAVAAVHPADTPVTVGTERDLAGLGSVSLAVAADVDGILAGSGYRSSEEALRQIARLGTTVEKASGSRLMLQTSSPESSLVTTLKRGDPMPYIERVLVERARDGFPPSTEMIALEIRGEKSTAVSLEELAGDVTVLGPMEVEDGRRWLLLGKLGKTRQDLRSLVGRWRDSGATVRIDVDPIDV